MSIHEYATSILSIVLGLGVANLLSGLAWMARNPKNDMYFYVFGVWNLSLLLSALGMWWGIWTSFKDLEVLTYWMFVPTFLSTALFYLASKILVPQTSLSTVRLDDNFPTVAKPLCLCIAGLVVSVGAAASGSTFGLEAMLAIGLVGIAIAGVFARRPVQHAAVAVAWLGVYLLQQSVQPDIL